MDDRVIDLAVERARDRAVDEANIPQDDDLLHEWLQTFSLPVWKDCMADFLLGDLEDDKCQELLDALVDWAEEKANWPSNHTAVMRHAERKIVEILMLNLNINHITRD